MKYGKKLLCLTLAMAMLLAVLTACGADNGTGNGTGNGTDNGTDNDAGEGYVPVKPPVAAPDENGEITFADQTFSVDTERLTVNLQLRSNEVLDISPLAWCTQLRQLSVNLTVTPHIYYDEFGDPHIAEMTATDLTPLALLVNLERLELNVGAIESLTPLTGLPKLSTLVLWVEGEVDLTPLAACPSLVELALGGRGTMDLTPLSRCGALANLRVDVYDAEWNSPDLSALSGAPALDTLSVGASNGLRELKNVPLRNLIDLNDSGEILEHLPGLDTLEHVEFSDEHLDDILPLLLHPGVTRITLEIGAQDIESFTVIKSADDPLLDRLITVIPAAQLRKFLTQGGESITLLVDQNRTAGVME